MTPEKFFRQMAAEELAKAEAKKPPLLSGPPTKADISKRVGIISDRLPNYIGAYLHLAQIDDPLRHAVREQAHLLLDVIYDACEELRHAK